jgi:hypothetical protein
VAASSFSIAVLIPEWSARSNDFIATVVIDGRVQWWQVALLL